MSTVQDFKLTQDPTIGTPFRLCPETEITVKAAPPSEDRTVRLGEHPGCGGIVRISAWAYLRTMAMLAWSAFRHPLRTTVIDLATGRIISHHSDG